MDYRERKYYLIKTAYYSYNMRHEIYRTAAPSIKYHGVDSCAGCKRMDIKKALGLKFYPQELVSCLIEEAPMLEFELRKAYDKDGVYSNWIEVTKEMLGQ